MDTIKVFRHAQKYMDSLAQGIDPISGAKVPEDSVLNQERLSRCFLYVSGILQDAIGQAAASSAPASTWEPVLASGALDRFEYSEEAMTLVSFLERLNSLREGTSAKKFSRTALTCWLMQEGLMPTKSDPDQQEAQFLPSKRGEAVGILTKNLEGQNGISYRYEIVLTRAAQQFLVCSLDRIIADHQSNWARRLALVDPEKAPYSAEPVSMRAFLKNLNDTFGWTSPYCINTQTLGDWLLEEGLLYRKTYSSGKVAKVATKKAESIGLIRPMRENGHLSHTALYTEAAQRYVVSHLFDIVSL